jgi:fatty acid desaturase
MTTIAARSDARGLRQLALHLCALAATGICLNLALGSLWSAPALVLHGVVLVFLFAAEHESIHRTAFRSRWLNDVVASLCGLAILLPAGYFRLFHFAHHRYTQDPARDPELAVAKPRTLAAYAWTVSGLPYAYERITTTLRHARGRVSEPFIPASAARRVVAEAPLVLCCYALVAIAAAAFGSWSPVIYWSASRSCASTCWRSTRAAPRSATCS